MRNSFSETLKTELGNLFPSHRLVINTKINNRQEFIDFIKRIRPENREDINSCIFRASLKNYTESVKFLLDTSTGDINYKDRSGNTALIAASINDNIDILQRLLTWNKSNINDVNNNGNTALIEASINGNLKSVTTLLKNNANVSITNRDGNTAFMEACRYNKLNIVKFFLDEHKVPDINKQNQDGKTALMYACKMGNYLLSKILIENGADINIKTSIYMSTALEFAMGYIDINTEKKLDYWNIIQMLLKHKAPITPRVLWLYKNIKDINIKEAFSLIIKQNSLDYYLRLFGRENELPVSEVENSLLGGFVNLPGSDQLYYGEVLPNLFGKPDSGKQRSKRSTKKRSKRSTQKRSKNSTQKRSKSSIKKRSNRSIKKRSKSSIKKRSKRSIKKRSK